MITIYDQNRNPNMNNRDHLDARPTRGGGQRRNEPETFLEIMSQIFKGELKEKGCEFN